MQKDCKREFEVRQKVYVVDYWSSEALVTQAEILSVDSQNERFVALLYGDTYQTYSFNDYGRLIFDTAEEASEAARKLPKSGTTVYQKIGDRVYKKRNLGISGQHFDGVYDLIILLDKGKNVSIKDIGVSIFLNETEARK